MYITLPIVYSNISSPSINNPWKILVLILSVTVALE